MNARKTWNKIGKTMFWVGWPVLFFYLRFSRRTRVVVAYKDEVLVLKGWLGTGKWILPGGGLHKGEKPEVGAVREIKEETGLDIEPDALIYFGESMYRLKGLRFKYYRYGVMLDDRLEPVIVGNEISHASWTKISAINRGNSEGEVVKIIEKWKNLHKHDKI